MKEKVLLIRATPNDIDIKAYNVQQVGIGKAFCDMGYDYDFVTFKRRSPRQEFVFYENCGCRAKCIELPRFRFLRWGINTSICNPEFLKQYDLIICQEYYQLQTFMVSRKANNVVMYSGPYYNMFMPKILSPIYDALVTKRLNKQLAAKFVKSELARAFLEKKGYSELENIGVALDTTRFEGNVELSPTTSTIVKFMKEHICILYVGSLCKRKNFPFLLEVYASALKRNPDLKFVIIGKSKISAWEKICGMHDEDYALKYFKKLPQHVKEGILHIERVDNPQLKYIYPLAKAFLLPSKLEIFGMVLLEAMYLKTPVITSLNGGSVTLIKDKETGIVVPKFDTEMWVNAIFRYLDDSQYSNMVVENASRLVKEKYNWTRLVHSFLKAKKK